MGDCMKKNGFTLIELMAVITILVILSLIIVPIVDKNVKRSKDEMYDVQIENIRLAGINYYTDNITLRPKNGESTSISLSDLIDSDYIGSVVNPKTGKEFSENIMVKVTNNSGKYIYLVCPIEGDC